MMLIPLKNELRTFYVIDYPIGYNRVQVFCGKYEIFDGQSGQGQYVRGLSRDIRLPPERGRAKGAFFMQNGDI